MSERSYEFDPIARTVRCFINGYTGSLLSEANLKEYFLWKSADHFVESLRQQGYVARGVPVEEKPSEQLFRIGGVYRQRGGEVVCLSLTGALGQTGIESGLAFANHADDAKKGMGINNLGTGKGITRDDDLIPGELTFNGSEWVPVEEEKAEEDLHERLMRTNPLYQRVHQQIASEPQHPRLTWADTKPVDRFEGYTVRKGSTDPQPNTAFKVCERTGNTCRCGCQAGQCVMKEGAKPALPRSHSRSDGHGPPGLFPPRVGGSVIRFASVHSLFFA